jgi:hypothetical protein
VKSIKQMESQEIVSRSLIIAITNFVDLNTKLESFRSGVEFFLPKPIDIYELSVIIQSLCVWVIFVINKFINESGYLPEVADNWLAATE